MQATSLYWFAAQQQTVHLHSKKLACFIQNLVGNLMNLVLSSKKINRKGQKMAKTKTALKTTHMWHSGPKG